MKHESFIKMLYSLQPKLWPDREEFYYEVEDREDEQIIEHYRMQEASNVD